MSNKLIVTLLILLVVVGGFLLFKNKSVAPTELEVSEENTQEETSAIGENVTPTTPSTQTPPTTTPASPVVKEFVVDNDHFSFKPASLTVNKGDTVKITFRNTGGTHDLKIDEFTGASTRILSAGETQTITFVADKAGSFEYYCSVGNHRAQGMWGTFKVL